MCIACCGKVVVVVGVGDGIGDSRCDGDAVLSRLVAQLLTVTSSTTSAHSICTGDCCTNDIWAGGTGLAKVVNVGCSALGVGVKHSSLLLSKTAAAASSHVGSWYCVPFRAVLVPSLLLSAW